MAINLLLNEMTPVDDVGLVHTIFCSECDKFYRRRRAYRSAQDAVRDYFSYCDMMASSGYAIKSRLGHAWFFEVCAGDTVVETVQVEWPGTDWNQEIKLLGHIT